MTVARPRQCAATVGLVVTLLCAAPVGARPVGRLTYGRRIGESQARESRQAGREPVAGALAARSRLIDFELEDQFGDTRTRADYDGHVVVALVTGRRTADLARQWGDALAENFPDELDAGTVLVLAVASLRGIPHFLRGLVVRRLPKRRDRWVVLDWKGIFASAYGLDTDITNLLVFDGSGALRESIPTTAVEPAQVQRLRAAIDLGLGRTRESP